MIHCKDCKFWKPKPLDDDPHRGRCGFPGLATDGATPQAGILCILYYDEHTLFSSLFTGPDFGCIHGEAT